MNHLVIYLNWFLELSMLYGQYQKTGIIQYIDQKLEHPLWNLRITFESIKQDPSLDCLHNFRLRPGGNPIKKFVLRGLK